MNVVFLPSAARCLMAYTHWTSKKLSLDFWFNVVPVTGLAPPTYRSYGAFRASFAIPRLALPSSTTASLASDEQSWRVSSRLERAPTAKRGVAAAAASRVGLKKNRRGSGQNISKEPGWVDEDEDQVLEKSKNQRKRDASSALELAYDLADLSIKNLKQVASISGMTEEMTEAITLAKSLGIDAKNGRKRQFAFVAKLLREQDMDVDEVQEIIQATKDGSVHAGVGSGALTISQDDLEEPDSEVGAKASEWALGLIENDPDVADAVYSLSDVVDGQHLRQLVRNAQKELAAAQSQPEPEPGSEAKGVSSSTSAPTKHLNKSQGSLKRYLQDVAVRILDKE